LPEWLWSLKQLRKLNIYGADLTSIDARIGELRELTFLDLNNNALENLPNSISQLTKLEVYKRFEYFDFKTL